MPVQALLTRLDPRRAPLVVLLLAPAVLLLLIVGLTPEPTRLIFAGDLAVYRRYGLGLLGGPSRTSTSAWSTRPSPWCR